MLTHNERDERIEMKAQELTEDEWAGLQQKARRAAKQVAATYGGMLSADDIEQDVMMKMLECPGVMKESLKLPDASTWKLVFKMAGQVSVQHQEDYKRFTGIHHYSTWDVRRLLQKGVFVDEEKDSIHEASEQTIRTGRRSKKDYAEYIGVDDKLDIQYGLKKLTPQQRETLIARYVLDERPHHEGVSRAIESLTRHMNNRREIETKNYEGPASRRVMSNATAQAITNNSY
jgi:DNA-directed RNA polymerase specialized sigma24 family protein